MPNPSLPSLTTTHMSSPFPFLLFFFFLLISTHSQSDSDPDQECIGKWIHIRKLPSHFNLDLLLNCSAYYPLYEDFCPYLSNHGLGHKTHNRSHSWYRTDPFMLELIFHRRMLEYPCLTSTPLRANAIYLPYYAGIDAFRYLYGDEYNNSASHGLQLYSYLREEDKDGLYIWERNLGHDHFLVMARPAWDFSQPLSNDPPLWGTSFLELPEFYNVTALTLESRVWPWQEQAIPYPTSFHPPSVGLLENWIKRARGAHRTTFMLFAGGGGLGSSPNIRRSIRDECENSTSNASNSSRIVGTTFVEVCRTVDCSGGVCEHDPYRYMKPMLQASFCLQPPGDTPTRRSTFDGILAGCIPVFFEESSAKIQYGWHLPENQYREFSVLIPKEEVVSKGLKILDVLMAIPKTEVRRMREKVIELIPRVTYRRHGGSMEWRGVKDAFDIAVDGAIDRIKSRVAMRNSS